MVELECKNVASYSSSGDEAAFFTWVQAIPAVVSISGRGHSIVLAVKSKRVADASLRELLSLFRRYRISMGQLAQFQNAQNEAWFASPKAFWFKPVFSSGSP